MKNKQKIEEINKILLAIEMDLDILESEFDRMTVDLAILNKNLLDLGENHRTLKSKNIIASLKEYKNNILESVYVKDKIKKIESQLSKIRREIGIKEKNKKDYEQQWHYLYDIDENEAKVLHFKAKDEKEKR